MLTHHSVDPALAMRAVFIGGASRSGTTMLGDLLGAHARHVCTPETSYKAQLVRCGWGSTRGDLATGRRILEMHPKFADLSCEIPPLHNTSLRALMEPLVQAYAARTGKPGGNIWIDHTPSNLAIGNVLLEEFPDSRIIHIVRDGRAVAASMLPLDWGPNNVIAAAREWVLFVGLGFALEAAFPERVHRVTYEELVRDPGPVLARLCRFAELEYQESMIGGGGLRVPSTTVEQHALVGKPPDKSRLDAWKTTLEPRDIELFEWEVKSLLSLLGYEPIYGHLARDRGPLSTFLYELRHFARDRTINRLRRRKRMAR